VWPPDAPITPEAPLREHWMLTPYANALPARLVERLLQVPGVTHAAVASGVPMVRSLGGAFTIPGRSDPSPAERGQMEAVGVRTTPGYFAALGMRLLAGRVITEEDRPGAPPVAVINRRLARMYWRDESSALGHLVQFVGDPAPSRIVGVVSDLRFWPASEPTPQIFIPVGQNPWSSYPDFALWVLLEQYFAVRVQDQSPRLLEAIERAITEVDAGAPVERARYMDTVMAETFGSWRVLAFMSAVALALVAIGIFGVVSYGVSQRTHEIGVRVALGASGGAILRLVLAGGLKIALVSASLGLAIAYWTTRIVEKDLYQVSPTDPIVFGAAGMGLVAVVLLATWLPARRAAGIDPLVALRAE
jgi:putative ABC transport system permease protein